MAARPLVRFLAVLILVVIPLAAAALVAEAVVRWRERNRATAPGTMPTLYYLHSRLRPALIRNREYFGWVRTDSLGLRGHEVPFVKSPGTLRILADGGSTTFDATVTADDSTWPAQLERLLMARRVADSVEVLNAGVPGYAVIDNLIRLQTDLYRLQPDVILLLQGHNDLHYALVGSPPGDPDTPGEQGTMTPWGHWLARHSLLYGKVEAARRALAATWSPGTYVPPGRDPERADAALAAATDRFRRDLTAYVMIARQGGARVAIIEPVQVSGELEAPRDSVERQAWENAFGGVPADVVFQGYAEFRRVMQEVAAEQGVTFIPTGNWGVEGPELYDYGDPIHLLDEGARRLAERLAIVLDSAGVLQPAH